MQYGLPRADRLFRQDHEKIAAAFLLLADGDHIAAYDLYGTGGILQPQLQWHLPDRFVGDLDGIEIRDAVGPALLIKHTRRPHNGGVDLLAADQQRGKDHDQHAEQSRVELHAHGILQGLMVGDAILGSIADQAFEPAGFFHHMIAGIDTRGAANALHLRTVADIDPSGAYFNALKAVDAIAQSAVLLLREPTARFTSFVVIGHDHRIPVQQNALQSTIRADDGTGLFAEEGIDAVEHAREDKYGGEAAKMLT